MLFWQMAWRNVWRYRRRSLLTVLTIALGLAFDILMRGIGDGFHEQMVDNSVRAGIGHLEVHRSGYQRDPALLKTLPDLPLARTRCARRRRICAAPRSACWATDWRARPKTPPESESSAWFRMPSEPSPPSTAPSSAENSSTIT